MIWHQAVRNDANGASGLGPPHQFQKILEILEDLEERPSVIPSIERVRQTTGWQISQRTGHTTPPDEVLRNSQALGDVRESCDAALTAERQN
jgi:hypothetical protein